MIPWWKTCKKILSHSSGMVFYSHSPSESKLSTVRGNKKSRLLSGFSLRRKRDSNPRRCDPRWFSRPVHSTTLPFLHLSDFARRSFCVGGCKYNKLFQKFVWKTDILIQWDRSILVGFGVNITVNPINKPPQIIHNKFILQ